MSRRLIASRLLLDLRRVVGACAAFLKYLVTRDRGEIGLGQLSAESAVAVAGRPNRYRVTLSTARGEPRDVTLTIDIYELGPARQPGGHYAYFSKRLTARPCRSMRVEIQYDWRTTASFSIDGVPSPPDDVWRGTAERPAYHSVSAVLRDSTGKSLERLTVYQELAP